MGAIKGNACTLQYKAEPTNNADAIPDALTGYASLVGVTSASISVSNATFEATSITDETTEATTRDFAVGTTSCSLSVEGVYDPALADNADELFTLCKAKTRVGVFWYNNQAEDNAVGGVGFCTSFELSAGMDDFVSFSASFELEGNPVIKTLD